MIVITTTAKGFNIATLQGMEELSNEQSKGVDLIQRESTPILKCQGNGKAENPHFAVEAHPKPESSLTAVARRSKRTRKTRSFSPEVEIIAKRRRTNGRKCSSKAIACRVASAEDATKETEFSCDLCNSPYITNPSRRGNRLKMSRCIPSPRHKTDPKTGKVLSLCNACGLAFDRPLRPQTSPKAIDPVEWKKHEEELEAFVKSLVDLLGDEDARKLCCLVFTKKPCQCLQNYIKASEHNVAECRSRALNFLHLLKEARRLSSLKFYNENEMQQSGKSKRPAIGLGNGQRKSKAFEEFVLKNRKVLREDLKLCERATQRILGYSNNFLHKKLKTDPEIAFTHRRLLQHWRERALKGQAEARRVLAEMLTPSGGSRCNCYRFITWVTGCSHSTISKVNEQMKKTGGDREPPPHGLKKWIKENPRQKKKAAVPEQVPDVPSTTPDHTAPTAVLSAFQQSDSILPESIPAAAQTLSSPATDVLVKALEMPSSITSHLVSSPIPLSQSALVYSIATTTPCSSATLNATGTVQQSPFSDCGQVTFQRAPSQITASSSNDSPKELSLLNQRLVVTFQTTQELQSNVQPTLSQPQDTAVTGAQPLCSRTCPCIVPSGSQLILQAIHQRQAEEQIPQQFGFGNPGSLASLQNKALHPRIQLRQALSQTQPLVSSRLRTQADPLQLASQNTGSLQQLQKNPANQELQQTLQLITANQGAVISTPHVTESVLTSQPEVDNQPIDQQVSEILHSLSPP
ncbi:uncharacterized protein LOC102355420 isoform X2 [Latimeria chalumnae]|uniref:uncharacterized protein LOC102355420 isoform X2 n=1 Tax=Latimeria chalumnae TaxID=7897 RepID=UPI0003C11060|nr:PREDICTED: uncharacterized protein LOC102355420 isoform X2 [Latimeria chalumnae]|eukprot:XP_005987445.1 PREDICTED: uncharacterized protein LOC102355420 isoform X2 [Latimeria chalumnae]